MEELIGRKGDLIAISVQIYQELLRLGTQPVSVIARTLGMKRTTMYYTLERLASFGIVREIGEGHMRFYAPAELTDVLKSLRLQRRMLLEKEKEFKRICGKK